MRIGIISDIHANRPALETVMEDLGNQQWMPCMAWAISSVTLPPERGDRADSERWHPYRHGEL